MWNMFAVSSMGSDDYAHTVHFHFSSRVNALFFAKHIISCCVPKEVKKTNKFAENMWQTPLQVWRLSMDYNYSAEDWLSAISMQKRKWLFLFINTTSMGNIDKLQASNAPWRGGWVENGYQNNFDKMRTISCLNHRTRATIRYLLLLLSSTPYPYPAIGYGQLTKSINKMHWNMSMHLFGRVFDNTHWF